MINKVCMYVRSICVCMYECGYVCIERKNNNGVNKHKESRSLSDGLAGTICGIEIQEGV